jgi:hypothetical protein
MPVPATTSRARNPSTEATSWSGKTKAEDERDLGAVGGLQPLELEAADE